MLCLAGNCTSRPEFALLRALWHLKTALLPQPLHALMVDALAVRPQQRMGAADAEARILTFDLCQFQSKRYIFVLPRFVAQGGTGHVQEAACFALGQTTFFGIEDVLALRVDRIGGFGYFF